MKTKYDKLVRDNIPDWIADSGMYTEFETRTLNHREYGLALCDKLIEEVGEFLIDPSIRELVDIQEVVAALVEFMEVSPLEFLKALLVKRQEKGKFEDAVLLISVTETEKGGE